MSVYLADLQDFRNKKYIQKKFKKKSTIPAFDGNCKTQHKIVSKNIFDSSSKLKQSNL